MWCGLAVVKGGSVALGQQRYVSDVVTFLREDLVLDT